MATANNTTIFVVLVAAAAIILIGKNFLGDYGTLVPAALKKETVAPIDDWKPFTSESNHFEAGFPNPPQHVSKSVPIPDTDKKNLFDIYISEQPNQTIFMVRVITYPDDYNFNGEALIRKGMEEMLGANDQNVLRKIEYGTFQGTKSLHFAVQNPTARTDALSFLIGRKLYLLSYVSHVDNYDDKAFSLFTDSFKLIKK